MAAAKKVESLSISCSRPGGRRRADMRFGKEPTIIPLSKLTKAKIKALKGDSVLTVKEVQV